MSSIVRKRGVKGHAVDIVRGESESVMRQRAHVTL
jgi:hypothetical protein